MQQEKSLVERLVALSPDHLGKRDFLKRRGSGVVGAKLGSRLIADNLRLIEEALACGVSRQSILDEINMELPEGKKLTLKGFDSAKWRHRQKLKKKAAEQTVQQPASEEERSHVVPQVEKNAAINETRPVETGSGVKPLVTDPGGLRATFKNFDPDALSDNDDV
ncbi:hypothetical protein ACLH0B_06435 [Aeromonas salmonicida]|uniref:hypothetical protein n=1 Tax=Aeromonas salmonicida TaxID=645 RepID=UPI003D021875